MRTSKRVQQQTDQKKQALLDQQQRVAAARRNTRKKDLARKIAAQEKAHEEAAKQQKIREQQEHDSTPPHKIICNANTLDDAVLEADNAGKLLLVTVLKRKGTRLINTSLTFNRDILQNYQVQKAINESFVFWYTYADTDEAFVYTKWRFPNGVNYPHLGLVDPRTYPENCDVSKTPYWAVSVILGKPCPVDVFIKEFNTILNKWNNIVRFSNTEEIKFKSDARQREKERAQQRATEQAQKQPDAAAVKTITIDISSDGSSCSCSSSEDDVSMIF
jgi:hypothetical protein